MNRVITSVFLGFALSITATAAETEKSETSQKAFLGVGVETLHPALTEQLSDVIGKGRGILVSSVTEGSPAAKAGLKQHDILTTYNNQKLYAPEQLAKLVTNEKPNAKISVGYVRGGKEHTAKVALGSQEAGAPTRFNRLFRRFTLPEIRRILPKVADKSQVTPKSKWTTFESMKLSRMDDDKFKAEIEFGSDDDVERRVFEGTRAEIRKAVEADEELPESPRAHILRSLDMRPQDELFRELQRLDEEMMRWPSEFGF